MNQTNNMIDTMQQELDTLRARIAELESALQQQQHTSHKDWIRNNLEEAQQIIDNIVGIKGVTEDPLKVAAQLEAQYILTPYTDMTNASMQMFYDSNVIAANTQATLQIQFVQPPHEELYGY